MPVGRFDKVRSSTGFKPHQPGWFNGGRPLFALAVSVSFDESPPDLMEVVVSHTRKLEFGGRDCGYNEIVHSYYCCERLLVEAEFAGGEEDSMIVSFTCCFFVRDVSGSFFPFCKTTAFPFRLFCLRPHSFFVFLQVRISCCCGAG